MGELQLEFFGSVYRRFALDPCCETHTAKGDVFYTPEEDGLAHDWKAPSVWVNPPYGRNLIDKWTDKAIEEVDKGNARLVILLIPYRAGTLWWDRLEARADEVRRIVGRLCYENPHNAEEWQGATFDSVLVVLRARNPSVDYGPPRHTRWDIRGRQRAALGAIKGAVAAMRASALDE